MSEFKFPASLSRGESLTSVTAFNQNSSSPIYQADEYHPHWDAILEGLRTGDPNVWELFDVADGIMSKFHQVTDRVSWNGSEVLWDGDPIHSVLADQLARAMEAGNSDAYTALAKFWEKLESNPNAHSREQAYDWLACHEFQITSEGDVVGYKGVRSNGEGVYVSTTASRVEGVPSAFVDGQPISPLSVVPNPIGSVVTMPRSEVTHDPGKSCERGLHVATRSYASSYGTVLEVHVNPRDIVSVPTADSGAKVRVCRYKIARVALDESVYQGQGAVLSDQTTENSWVGDVGYKVQ